MTRTAVALFLLLALSIDLAAQDKKLPNIVIIFADDLGYGDIGSFGADDLATPNIDRLGAEGMRFTDFYAASPVCSPSRAALLTGRYPVRMGINGVFFPESIDGLDPEEITIVELLQRKGYRSSIVGKWHLGHHHKHLPLQNGFDEYFGIPYSNDMEMLVYMRGNDVESYEVDQRYSTRRFTEEAVSFIERSRNTPFFLLLAPSMPHVPLYVSERFAGSSQRGLYGDVIEEIDWSVGRILDTLNEQGLDRNTLVIFTSDNGPWTVMEQLGGSAGPLRGGKMFAFEGGMRVPTLARWPAVIPAGSESTDMANMMDWFPTFATMAGVPLPQDRAIDGRDILPVLSGTGGRGDDEFFYFHQSGQLRAYRKGDWKLKKAYPGNPRRSWQPQVEAHPLSLFNLRSDPAETINLADAHPEIVARMQKRMEAYLATLGELPPSKVMRQAADRSHFEILDSQDQ